MLSNFSPLIDKLRVTFSEALFQQKQVYIDCSRSEWTSRKTTRKEEERRPPQLLFAVLVVSYV